MKGLALMDIMCCIHEEDYDCRLTTDGITPR